MIGWLKGKKSYILGAGWVVWGGVLYLTGDEAEGTRHVMEGLALIFLRQGVAKASQAKS